MAHYLYRPWEYYYNKLKEGKGDSADFMKSVERFAIHLPVPENLPILDAETIFLLGKRPTGEYVVIADENNNNSILDDPVHTISHFTESKDIDKLPLLPLVHINNLQAFYHGKVITFSKSLRLKPFIIKDNSGLNKQKSTFHLVIISTEYLTGTFQYDGRKYKVGVRDFSEPVVSDSSQYTIVKFAPANDDSAFLRTWDSSPAYYAGDTVVLNNSVFVISSVSPGA
jgi:hypothetical protein